MLPPLGNEETAELVDGIKSLGFQFATRAGMTIGLATSRSRPTRPSPSLAADDAVDEIEQQFRRGLITEEERYDEVIEVWQETTDDDVGRDDEGARPVRPGHDDGPVGARGNKGNIGQMAGMRGLMADPSGRIIELPIRSTSARA